MVVFDGGHELVETLQTTLENGLHLQRVEVSLLYDLKIYD